MSGLSITSTERKVNVDSLSVEDLARNTNLSDQQKVAGLTRSFEAILVRSILENAQKPLLHKNAEQNSNTAGIYRDLITNQLADGISRGRGLGLANDLKRQLVREAKPESGSAAQHEPQAPTGEKTTSFHQPGKHPAAPLNNV